MAREVTFRLKRPSVIADQLAPPFPVTYTPLTVPSYTTFGATGSTAIASTNGESSPLLTVVQSTPSLTLFSTPTPPVPAYSVPELRGSTATARTGGAAVAGTSAPCHVAPPSVERATPLPGVPTNTRPDNPTSSSRRSNVVKPVLAAVHVPPPALR